MLNVNVHWANPQAPSQLSPMEVLQPTDSVDIDRQLRSAEQVVGKLMSVLCSVSCTATFDRLLHLMQSLSKQEVADKAKHTAAGST